MTKRQVTETEVGNPGSRDVGRRLIDRIAGAYRAATGPGADTAAADDHGSDRGGTMIGAYRLIERIGRGGMGEVWLAERADGAYRARVAVKLLRAGVDAQALSQRFVRERQILAGLDHPNIARLLDGGSGEDGTPYLVMERVEGEVLTDFIERRRLDLRARLDLFVTVCDAVACAHRNLIVHRDLKPSNVLVDRHGEVKLLDFGIGKLLTDDSADEGADVTRTELLPMTVAYAAPEQILGEPVTTATDVYALGVVLYELLTGRRPHERETTSLPVLASAVRTEEVTRPSLALAQAGGATAVDRRLARALRGDLDTIVLTALRQEPDRRYASAAALAEDLRRYLEGQTIRARPDTTGYRVAKFLRRHRLGVTATAVVMLALATGLAIAVWQAGQAREQAHVALAEYERAEAAKAFLVGLFEVSNPQNPAGDAGRTVLELLRSADAAIGSRLDGQPLVQAEMRISVAGALRGMGDDASARALIDQALAQFDELTDVPPLARGVGLHLKAAVLVDEGRMEEAERTVRRALDLLGPLPPTPENARRLRATRTTLARILNLTGREDEALALRLLDLEERSRDPDIGPGQLATVWYNLGVSYLGLERYDESLSALRRAEALLEGEAATGSRRQVLLAAALALTLDRLGRLDEATVYARKLEDGTRSHFGDTVFVLATNSNVQAQLALTAGRWRQAEAPARLAWRYATEGALDIASAARTLLTIQFAAGAFDEAASVAASAAALTAEQRGEHHPMVRHLRAAEAYARWRLDGAPEHLAALEQAVQALRQGPQRRLHGQAAAWLSLAQSDPDAAQRWRREAETALIDAFGAEHPAMHSLEGARWIPIAASP